MPPAKDKRDTKRTGVAERQSRKSQNASEAAMNSRYGTSKTPREKVAGARGTGSARTRKK